MTDSTIGSGGDYTTIAAWLATSPGSGDRGLLKNQDFGESVTWTATYDGATLRAEDGASVMDGRPDTTVAKPRLMGDSSTGHGILISGAATLNLEYLVVVQDDGDSSNECCRIDNASAVVNADSCVFWKNEAITSGSECDAFHINSGSWTGSITAENCVFGDFERDEGGVLQNDAFANGWTLTMRNCIAYVHNAVIETNNRTVTGVFEGCVFYSTDGTAFAGSWDDLTIKDCWYSGATPSATSSTLTNANPSSSFGTATSNDVMWHETFTGDSYDNTLRIADDATNNEARNAVPNSRAPYTTLDIEGDARPVGSNDNDAGPYEWDAKGGGGTTHSASLTATCLGTASLTAKLVLGASIAASGSATAAATPTQVHAASLTATGSATASAAPTQSHAASLTASGAATASLTPRSILKPLARADTPLAKGHALASVGTNYQKHAASLTASGVATVTVFASKIANIHAASLTAACSATATLTPFARRKGSLAANCAATVGIQLYPFQPAVLLGVTHLGTDLFAGGKVIYQDAGEIIVEKLTHFSVTVASTKSSNPSWFESPNANWDIDYSIRAGVRISSTTPYWRFFFWLVYGGPNDRKPFYSRAPIGVQIDWTGGNYGASLDWGPNSNVIGHGQGMPPTVIEWDPVNEEINESGNFFGQGWAFTETGQHRFIRNPRQGGSIGQFAFRYDPAQESDARQDWYTEAGWGGHYVKADGKFKRGDLEGWATGYSQAYITEYDSPNSNYPIDHTNPNNPNADTYSWSNSWNVTPDRQHDDAGIHQMCQMVVDTGKEGALDMGYAWIVKAMAARWLAARPAPVNGHSNLRLNYGRGLAMRGKGRILTTPIWLWRACDYIHRNWRNANDEEFGELAIALAIRVNSILLEQLLNDFELTYSSSTEEWESPTNLWESVRTTQSHPPTGSVVPHKDPPLNRIYNGEGSIAYWEMGHWFQGIWQVAEGYREFAPDQSQVRAQIQAVMLILAERIYERTYEWSTHPWWDVGSAGNSAYYAAYGWDMEYEQLAPPRDRSSPYPAATSETMQMYEWMRKNGIQLGSKLDGIIANRYGVFQGYRWTLPEGGNTLQASLTASASASATAAPTQKHAASLTASASATAYANPTVGTTLSASLTAVGSASATATPTQTHAASLAAAGSGSATLSPKRIRQASLSASASATVTASAGSTTHSASLTASASATVTATPTQTHAASLSAAGSGSATASPKLVLAGGVAASGSGSAALSPKLVLGGSLTAAGAATVYANGSIGGVLSASLTAAGSASATANPTQKHAASLAAAGAASATLAPTQVHAASLAASGVATVYASGTLGGVLQASLAASGAASATLTPRLILGASAAPSGSATVTASPTSILAGSLAASGSATVAASPIQRHAASLAAAGAATVTANPDNFTGGPYEVLGQKIRSAFVTHVAASLSIPVEYDNRKIVITTGTWARMRLEHGSTEQIAWGRENVYRQSGQIRFEVRSPAMGGEKAGREAADTFVGGLRGLIKNNVTYGSAGRVGAGRRDGPWWVQEYACPFYSDFSEARVAGAEQLVAVTRANLWTSIASRFSELVEDVHGVPVLYDDFPFDGPQNQSWVRLTIADGQGSIVDSGSTYRTPGIATAQVFAKALTGTQEQVQIIDTIATSFRAVSVKGVTFATPSVQTVGETDTKGRRHSWWQANVVCPFFFHETVST